jgi:uncharacterized membrane protein
MTVDFRFDRAREFISELMMPILGDESINNAAQVTIQLMNYIKIPVTNSTIQTRVEEHAEFPSLTSISDALNNWNVKNKALRVEKENLGRLPVPFVAHLISGVSLFEIVTKVTETKVYYLTSSGIERKKSIETFLSAWTGVALVIQPSYNYKEPGYHTKISNERWQQFRKPFILTSSIFLAVMFVVSIYGLYKPYFFYVSVLFLLKLTGLVVTSLLLMYELNSASPAIKKICSLHRKLNCRAVLGSKAAKIFGRIGWSEIGFFYFAGGIIYLLTSLFGIRESIEMLFVLNLLSLPYIFYSLFYQWRIVKAWCPLCLLVQGLLLSEFLTFLIAHPFPVGIPNFPVRSIISMAIAFYLPVFFWVFSKRFIIKATDGQVYKKEFSRLKHNAEFFDIVLTQQKKVMQPPDDLGIVIGDDNSTNKIVMISNPSCIACQVAHKTIRELLFSHKNLKVQMLFTSSGNADSSRSEIIRHVISLNETDKEKALLALDDWYMSEIKAFRKIENKFPLRQEGKYEIDKIMEMDKWCRQANISATPTFFVRGYQLPAFYNVSDLSYLLV